MQEICSSNSPVVSGICDLNSSQHHHRINMCLQAVLQLVQVLLLNMFKVQELSGLFFCQGEFVKICSAWGKEEIAGLWFARERGIITQADTNDFCEEVHLSARCILGDMEEISKDDKMFLAVVEKGSKKVDEHYEVPLPCRE